LRASTRVSVLEPGYAEHRHAWQRAGHSVVPVGIEQLNEAVRRSNVLVLINPNNPTAACFPAEQLLDWHAQLAARSGWLVVDEAFMDVTPASSLAPHAARPGLIVLRSLGKFFGLAGARVGFVCAHPQLLRQLNALLGPWAVSGPARWVAMEALRDRAWQSAMRQRLAGAESRFQNLLTRHGLAPDGGCALFQWVCTPYAADVHGALARRGVLTRLFHRPAGLRFGLPGDDADWRRLDDALAQTAEWGVNGAAV
jgi:cobalamin biosynthetic protein CobC